MKIEHTAEPQNNDTKRQYLPIVITDTCKCGREVKMDLRREYLSYPDFNAPIPVTLYCGDCGEERTHNVVLRVRMEEVFEGQAPA